MNYLKKNFIRFNNYLVDFDLKNASLWLTLVWVLTFVSLERFSQSSVLSITAFFGLVFFKNIKESRVYWLFLIAAYLLYFYKVGPNADNHKFLYLYWLMCISSYTFHKNLKVLEKSASLLIGIVFIFGTFWKIYGGEYIDGSFFNITFVYDYRLQHFSQLFLGYDEYIGKINTFLSRNYLLSHFVPKAYDNTILISSMNKSVSYLFAYFTILIEALLGFSFIFKVFKNDKDVSDIVLIVFLLSVYWLLSVTGFGALLLAIALMQSKTKFTPYYFTALVFICFVNWPK